MGLHNLNTLSIITSLTLAHILMRSPDVEDFIFQDFPSVRSKEAGNVNPMFV